MAYTTVYKNIIFIEGDIEGAIPKYTLSSDLSFGVGAHLKNLNDVKDQLVSQAIANGVNCITNFTYGQRHKFLAWSYVSFYGTGVGCIISDELYRELLEKYLPR